MRLQPWMSLGGIELLNGVRTLQYLRLGLGGGGFSVDTAQSGGLAAGPGLVDIYGDAYLADPVPAESLGCFCGQITTRSGQSNYAFPAYDPAPWYDATRPESGDFLGIVPDEIDVAPVAARQVQQRVPFGASIGPNRPKARVVAVRGTMYATSDAGMAYGERWLAMRLNGGACATGCAPDALELLMTCSAGGFRTLRAAGTVDGPIFGSISKDIGQCRMQTVAWQQACGNPFLLADAVTLSDTTLAAADNTAVVATMSKLGTRLTIFAGTPSDVSNVTVTMTPGACPPAGAPSATFVIASLTATHTLVIDSAARTVTDNNAGGLSVLSWSGLFPWLEVCANQSMCISIDPTGGVVNANTRAKVESILMEV